ncbi:MAG: sigma-70 family RNA polymerase sigma factor [Ilumatobacteraceae bacterium]
MNRAATHDDRVDRFESVAAAVFEPLQRYARRRADPVRAQDVVADTLVVLWRQLDRVPAGAELPWCYGVARKCLANTRRATIRHERLIDRIASNAQSVVAEHEDPALQDDHPELRAALARLSAADRELVQMWAWEGLEPREIAVALQISANAVSIRLHRIKQRLRNTLGQGKELDPAGHKPVGTEEDRHG